MISMKHSDKRQDRRATENMVSILKRIVLRLKSKWYAGKRYASLSDYWQARVKMYGRRCVLNLAHAEEEFDEVTGRQKQILFPLLGAQLNGNEKTLLDFGCGPGRFTAGLAELIYGHATGVDIVPELLELAPRSSQVDYHCIAAEGALPFGDASFDVVWSCLVLGGIPDSAIHSTLAEIARVLRPGGLFFYVENTAHKADTAYWFLRSEDAYVKLGTFCGAKVIGHHQDVGDTITVFCGSKPGSSQIH